MFSAETCTSSVEDRSIPINWEKCVLCQLNKNEKLVNPVQNPRGSDEGYKMLASNLEMFHEFGAIPFPLNISQIDDGTGIKNTMMRNKASWHKSCYLKCNNSKLKRAEEKYKREHKDEPQVPSPVKTRRLCSTEYVQKTCLFCESPGTKGNPLHKVQTKTCDEFIRKNAKVLKNTKITSKVSERCDLISLEAEYHKNCYTRFRNCVRDSENPKTEDVPKRQIEALAFARLVAYINDYEDAGDDLSRTFSLPHLTRLYATYMKELGMEYDVHATRLKDRLLEECPYLQACDKNGKETVITFRTDIKGAIRSLLARDYDVESKALCDAAMVVRADVIKSRDINMEGDFSSFHHTKTPSSMLTLVKMIIDDPCSDSTRDGSEDNDHVVTSIAQLLPFHIVKHRKGDKRRHNQKQETPVPVYLAMKLYGETRKKKLIDLTYQLGMSISYDRLDAILTQRANTVCSFYNKEGVVCPPSLVQGVFTTASVDNVDHNTSSTTAISSFHGTAISLMQHFQPGQSGQKRVMSTPESVDLKKRYVMKLPADYAVVQPCFVDIKSAKCTLSDICTYNLPTDYSPFSEELIWLEKCTSTECITWGAYHASQEYGTEHHKTVSTLLPIFIDQAHSAAMMIHTMNVVQKAVKNLNPNQIPVLVADQPLYALLKQIQFQCPDTHGEDKFFVLMGGLHIEMAALRVVGQWLNHSGWINALVLGDVTTLGRAESLITAGHVTRTRYAHQVTVAALYALQQKAYLDYSKEDKDSPRMTFEEWRRNKCENVPQFKYWDIAMNLQLLVLQFVRAVRNANFSLYMISLRKLVPWFFALDCINYARWVSLHIRDLAGVHKTHPELSIEFQKGLFVAKKSQRPFSAMALDQAHEQLNALIKGDGGMVGLTESPDSLRKWIIAGPELAATVQSFEQEVLHIFDDQDQTYHHSQKASMQQRFERDFRNLKEAIAQLGNPFLEASSDLYNIDSKKFACAEVVNTVMNIEMIGETQYEQFRQERLRTSTKNLMDPIKQNKLPLFSTACRDLKNKTKAKLSGLKNDCALFSRLYIATSEHRSGDLDVFFSHENQPSPPSLSVCGEPRSCTKSDLIRCLVDCCPDSSTQNAPPVHVKILDGPAIVHMLSPGQSKTFDDYVERVFLPFTRNELATVLRVDFVWDKYNPDSLKNWTRKKRGDGIRTRVALTTKIPKSWPCFLRDSANKEELFRLLATQVTNLREVGKDVYSTYDLHVLSTSERETLSCLSPCNHEEADTRIIVHVADAVRQGHTKVLVRTVDTDVLAIAVSFIQKIEGLEELWIHIGTGKKHQYLAAHNIATNLGPDRSRALPMFHAFSGCDTVSSFGGKGKKSAFEAWQAYPEATNGFIAATAGDIEGAMQYLEKFVVTMYDRSSKTSTVNECRKILFTKKDRQIENIPPTQNALKQHTLRSIYQGGLVWGQSLELQQNLPCPSSWGWNKTEEGWTPVWTSLPIAPKACLELVRCKCKKGCGSRCHCIKKDMKCTDLCLCGGVCN